MSHPSRRSRSDNRARWRAVVDRYASSPLSQREFCLRHDVALSSFVRWRRVFAAESAAVVVAPSASTETSGFVAVRVEPSVSPGASNAPLSITLAGGVRIENVDLANVPIVAALLAAL